jgi:hypothetical protein
VLNPPLNLTGLPENVSCQNVTVSFATSALSYGDGIFLNRVQVRASLSPFSARSADGSRPPGPWARGAETSRSRMAAGLKQQRPLAFIACWNWHWRQVQHHHRFDDTKGRRRRVLLASVVNSVRTKSTDDRIEHARGHMFRNADVASAA